MTDDDIEMSTRRPCTRLHRIVTEEWHNMRVRWGNQGRYAEDEALDGYKES